MVTDHNSQNLSWVAHIPLVASGPQDERVNLFHLFLGFVLELLKMSSQKLAVTWGRVPHANYTMT